MQPQPPRRRRLRGLFRRTTRSFVPLLIWLAAIAGVLALLPHHTMRMPIAGIVETQRYDVVAAVDGRLTAVMVDRHARVESGQVVARLADDDLRLQLTRARCELELMRSDMARSEAELTIEAKTADARHQLDAAAEARRRASDVESAHLDELGTRAEIEEAKIRLQGVTIEVDRLRALERQAIASDAELVRVGTEKEALQKRISELEGVLREQRARVASARERLATLTVTAAEMLPRDTLLEPLRWQLKMQEAELERIALLSRSLDVVAPAGGFVEEVLTRSGQWVASGDPVVRIVDTSVRRILAYLPESARSRVTVASAVEVMRDATPGVLRPTSVISLSPALVLVPQRLWRDPRIEEWAIEAVLAPHGDEAPGERVSMLLPQ